MQRKSPKKVLPLSKVYALLESGPVVLLTTANKKGANTMPMSWHTMMEFEPPYVGCIISDRNYSFNILKSTKECVISIPTKELLKKVVACGNTSGRDTNKFKTFGLTVATASAVKAPLIDECYVNLECKVIDTKLVKKYGFFVLEVIKAWIDSKNKMPQTIHHQGKGEFMVAGKIIKTSSKKK
ncbi:MAG: flavin reductase family protein [Oligoflexia bacterium]|nr:flavin reductase family protein [Oligoflexia bacterium]